MGVATHELPLPEFLKALGKQEIKPGGAFANRRAVEKLAVSHLDSLLVVGPQSAETAFHLAVTTRASVTALVSNLSEALSADDAALARHCRFEVGSVEALPGAPQSFSAVLVESTLSLLPPARRAAALAELARVCKPGARLALHELCWRQPPTPELEAGLREVWKGEVYPLVARGWWDALEAAGFGGIEADHAVVSYFTRKGMETDEGENAANLFHAAFEDEACLERFIRAYREFADQRRYHGVIIALATRR